VSGARIFGTDGIRDRAFEGWLAPDRLLAIGRSLSRVLLPAAGGERRGVLIGHDGRFSADAIRAALSEGLRSAGVPAVDGGLMTPPALAFLTRRGGIAGGIMISASHNPAEDNGIKFFGPDGDKLSDELELRLEQLLAATGEDPRGERAGTAAGDPQLLDPYLEHVAGFPSPPSLRGFRIALDCANGGGSRIAPAVFERLAAEVFVTHAAPDGRNINAGCGALHPESLAAHVLRHGCQFGLCLDGDGDRSILVDERGSVIDGDGILTAVGLDLLAADALPHRTLVATVMSNLGLEQALATAGGKVVRTQVGDRAVVKGMREGGFELGGEKSGHVIFGARHHYIGDGLFTGLRVLEIMQRTGKTLSDLVAPFEPFPQVLLNVPVASKPPLAGLPAVQGAISAAEAQVGSRGRVFVRYSGTENLCRVMLEGESKQEIDRLAESIAAVVREALG
jgi:phosphoglucosamine mutase